MKKASGLRCRSRVLLDWLYRVCGPISKSEVAGTMLSSKRRFKRPWFSIISDVYLGLGLMRKALSWALFKNLNH